MVDLIIFNTLLVGIMKNSMYLYSMSNQGLTKTSEKMMDALFAFKGMAGNGGVHSADTILAKLSGTDINGANLNHNHSSETLFKNRLNFVSIGAEGYFTSVNLNKPAYTPLARRGLQLL